MSENVQQRDRRRPAVHVLPQSQLVSSGFGWPTPVVRSVYGEIERYWRGQQQISLRRIDIVRAN